MIEVIGDDAKFSPSNAMLEWLAGRRCSFKETHGRHAFTDGTMVSFRAGGLERGDGESAGTKVQQNNLQTSPLTPLRQGISSRCRHVAPALPLC
jgi:hypothetical protein